MLKSISAHAIRTKQQPTDHYLTRYLDRAGTVVFTVYVSISAFGLYTCVYALRKTFAAATFSDLHFAGIDYKIWLVTFQVCGYALSKFAGIKLIAEMAAKTRSKSIFAAVTIAWLSWLLFGFVDAPYNLIFLFINGLVLGLVWGMVFGFLEGRKVTEILGAALSISFIFSSGLCRTVGGYMLRYFPEKWMPFASACLFFVPLLLFLFMLDKAPRPTKSDELERTRRRPMNKIERRKFILYFLPGIILFVVAYTMLTAFRDFRDNFSAEVWMSLGYGNSPAIYAKTEVPVTLGVLVMMGAMMFVKNNKLAFMANHVMIMTGMMLIGISTFLFESDLLTPTLWMTLTGLGLYLGYVPFNSVFFDRLLATFQYAGTVGFIMYVADAFGYLGSVAVLFVKEFGNVQLSWLEFLIAVGYFISIAGTVLISGSLLYFHKKHNALVN